MMRRRVMKNVAPRPTHRVHSEGLWSGAVVGSVVRARSGARYRVVMRRVRQEAPDILVMESRSVRGARFEMAVNDLERAGAVLVPSEEG